jgi:hypothetical protein
MNALAEKIIHEMKGTPFVMALLIINTIMLGTFAFTMHKIGEAAERRDQMLEKCVNR